MNFTTKTILSALAIMLFAMVGCEDNAICDGRQCADGQVLDAFTCECVDIAPCAGKTCEDDEILDITTCDCIYNNIEVISGVIEENTTWTASKVYELANKVVVDNGATLTIEPGTIIKGREGVGSQATALIVARGSKIEACGTAADPIIFTSELDNISAGETTGTNLNETDKELWGGLIILGGAPISAMLGFTVLCFYQTWWSPHRC